MFGAKVFVAYAKVCYWVGKRHSMLDESRKVFGAVNAAFNS
jgi:hypothetical protein